MKKITDLFPIHNWEKVLLDFNNGERNWVITLDTINHYFLYCHVNSEDWKQTFIFIIDKCFEIKRVLKCNIEASGYWNIERYDFPEEITNEFQNKILPMIKLLV